MGAASGGDPGYSTSYSSSGYEPPKEEKPKKINTRYGKFDEAQAASFALDPSILIPAAQPGQAGNYTVVVTNGCGSVTSNSAVLTVNNGPVFTQHPASTGVCASIRSSASTIANG